MSRLSVENLLSHSTETLRTGTLLCCVLEIFRQPKSLWIKGRVKYQDFRQKYRILRIKPVTLAIARTTDIIRQYPRSLIHFAHSPACSLSAHIASRFYYWLRYLLAK